MVGDWKLSSLLTCLIVEACYFDDLWLYLVVVVVIFLCTEFHSGYFVVIFWSIIFISRSNFFICCRYGVSKQDEAFNAELSDLYCRWVSIKFVLSCNFSESQLIRAVSCICLSFNVPAFSVVMDNICSFLLVGFSIQVCFVSPSSGKSRPRWKWSWHDHHFQECFGHWWSWGSCYAYGGTKFMGHKFGHDCMLRIMFFVLPLKLG